MNTRERKRKNLCIDDIRSLIFSLFRVIKRVLRWQAESVKVERPSIVIHGRPAFIRRVARWHPDNITWVIICSVGRPIFSVCLYVAMRPTFIGPVHKGTNHVSERDSDPFLIWKPDFTLCEDKALSNQAFETRKWGRFGLWSAWRAWFWGHVNAKLFRNVIRGIRACAFWRCALKLHAWVNQRGLRSRNKLFTSQCADPVRDWDGVCNACERTYFKSRTQSGSGSRSKRLSVRDSFFCEQAHCLSVSFDAPPRHTYAWGSLVQSKAWRHRELCHPCLFAPEKLQMWPGKWSQVEKGEIIDKLMAQ